MAKYSSGRYRSGSLKTTAKAIMVIFAALTLIIIGAGGRVIAENLLMPLFKDITPAVTPLPEGFKSGIIKLTRLNLHCVELNKYDDPTEASSAADHLRKKGGAGYIFEDSGKYRVIASGYTTQEQALSVAKNQAQDVYSPAVFLISSGSISFNVSCKKESFEALTEACSYYPELVCYLAKQAVELEKQETTVAALKMKYSSVAAELERIAKRLENIPSAYDDELINELMTLYNNSILQIKKIFMENFKDSIDFFAEIRYNYIQMAVYYSNAVQNLC